MYPLNVVSEVPKKKAALDVESEHRGLLFTFIIQHQRFDLSFFGMGSYMIIGLTPFLYLYDTRKTEKMQDGKFTIIVAGNSCNAEK